MELRPTRFFHPPLLSYGAHMGEYAQRNKGAAINYKDDEILRYFWYTVTKSHKKKMNYVCKCSQFRDLTKIKQFLDNSSRTQYSDSYCYSATVGTLFVFFL
jgi:hypothetical protein